jgi:mRNA interferase MazF
MHKDFDTWNKKKKQVHEQSDFFGVHQRELWWVSFGLNVGVEIDGKNDSFERPALILRKFNNQMLWVIPVTSQEKDTIFYEPFSYRDDSYYAAITQLRTVSTKRLLRKIGMVPKPNFLRIQEKVAQFALTDETPHKGGVSRRPKP